MERRYSEDDLIASVFAPIAGQAALGLADDAALLPASSDGLVVTTDALVSGVHFFADDPPGMIARKALRVNLSDLAAKGAEPLGFLLALALPSDWTNDWLHAFASGLGEDAGAYHCPLLGGDTVATPGTLTISITALGRAPRGCFVARRGARAGDAIYVTGTIGDAALGLALRLEAVASLKARDPGGLDREPSGSPLAKQARDFLLGRYLLPQPRVALAPALREHASAAMDISDGLAGDLTKLTRVSNIGAVVELARVPLSPAAREAIAIDPTLFDVAMTGGDDYEILCCVRGDSAGFEAAARNSSISVTKIGEATADAGPPVFLDAQKNIKVFNRLSFSHF
jgi:thiamine-monophosphate kinase